MVHTKTIRSLYPKTLEIPFHSTDQPVLRVLLPRSAVYPRPILEMTELKLTKAIPDVHTVDLGTLHHKIQQQQLTPEFQVRRSLVRFLFISIIVEILICIYSPLIISSTFESLVFLGKFPIYVTSYLFILLLTSV